MQVYALIFASPREAKKRTSVLVGFPMFLLAVPGAVDYLSAACATRELLRLSRSGIAIGAGILRFRSSR